jgi:hypothetical protein
LVAQDRNQRPYPTILRQCELCGVAGYRRDTGSNTARTSDAR